MVATRVEMEPTIAAALVADKLKGSLVRPLVDRPRLELNMRTALVPRSSMGPEKKRKCYSIQNKCSFNLFHPSVTNISTLKAQLNENIERSYLVINLDAFSRRNYAPDYASIHRSVLKALP